MKEKEHHQPAKRDQFLKNQKKSYKREIIISIVVVVALMTLMAVSKLEKNARNSNRVNLGTQDYFWNIKMKKANSKVSGGRLSFDLAKVKKNKIVYFSYPKNQIDIGAEKQALPMLAYIEPDGELITAVSMCEPCKSSKFHIEPDETLTCDTCNTKYDIQTLEGIKGQCVDYPPDEVNYKITSGKVLIDEAEIINWKTRL